MDGNSHYHKQIGQECLQKGSCDYGLYPLKTRFYMDQIPLDLFQYGKRSLNPIGAGYCQIMGTDKKVAKRWGIHWLLGPEINRHF